MEGLHTNDAASESVPRSSAEITSQVLLERASELSDDTATAQQPVEDLACSLDWLDG